ncbi:MAG: Ig-like domain-containing protein, partial [Planctomycetaceae bacterium]|nr:Ig-like domain-containing protein [Planctomycetaceae bacterium]
MTSVGSARDVPNGANCLVSNARDSSSYAEAHLDEMELTTSKERDTMHCPRKILSYLLTLLLCCGFAAVAQAEIRVFPEQVQLTGAKARQQLIVQTVVDGELAAQPAEVTWTSDTPDVMTVSAEGVITPVKNGEAKATAKVGDETLAVSVQITGMDQPHAWEFRRHVVPILSKTGCNTGPCHGALAGKGGFRLSLRGFDPPLDVLTLRTEFFGRRVNIVEPAESLLLKKPLMEVAHGGGRRLSKNGASYSVLHDWIAEGMRIDEANAPSLVKIEVFPNKRTLREGAPTQQLMVKGTFTDGSVRDLTALTVFSSSNEQVASVSENGLVEKAGRGEAAILARYLDKMDTSFVTFLEEVPGF